MRFYKFIILLFIIQAYSIDADAQLWKQYADSAKIFNDRKKTDSAIQYYILAKEELQKDSVGTNSYAQTCTSLGNIYKTTRKFDKAEPLFIEAREIREKLFGKLNADYASSCNYLGSLYENMRNYEKAEPLFLEALQIREKVLGKKNNDYATSCNNLGILYENMHKYDKAEPFYIKAVQIREGVLGKDHPDYGTSCHTLATLYNRMFQLVKAEPLYLEAKRVREKIGKENPNYLATINNLAVLYEKMSNHEKAELLYLEKKQIVENMAGKTHIEYGLVCENLAILYNNKLEFKKAELYFIEAKNIIEQSIGKKQPDYAIVCFHFANYYSQQDIYEKAEPLYLEAKQIMESTIGKNQPEYTNICQNLAITYTKMGLFEKAEPLYLEALQIREKIFTKNHTLYASTCENLAILYHRSGEFEKAEAFYIEALQINGDGFSKDHPEYALRLDNLASLYIETKQYEKARPLLFEAKQILEKNPGKQHPTYASNCTNLASLFKNTGEYEKAEAYYLEAKQIRETVQGKEHPDYAEICFFLANIYRRMNKSEKAYEHFKKAFESQNIRVNNFFLFASEAEQQQYLQKILSYEKSYFSFISNISRSYIQLAYDVSLSRRNLILNSSQHLRWIINNSNDTSLKIKYDDWIDLRKQLSSWYAAPIADRAEHVKTLEEQTNTLEKELNQLSVVFKKEHAQKTVTWKTVQQNLKPNEAAIEFIDFKYNDGERSADSIYYIALLVRKDKPDPVLVRLFEKKRLDSLLISSADVDIEDKINSLYYRNQTLYDLVWEPFEKKLKGISTIYFAPAGNLFKLSLAAIKINDKQLLSDKYKLIQLNTTAALADRSENFITANDKIQLYGGVQYNADTTVLKDAVKKYYTRSESPAFIPGDITRGSSWNYLPGTEKEISQILNTGIEKKFTITSSSGIDATEESVKAISGNSSPSVLHIATHGFFFPDQKENISNKQDDIENNGNTFKQSDNPLFRSGLIFAGANNAWEGNPVDGIEDGILTAYEVSNMYLPNTKLVVLSACETALGDIQGSEGVYGLQRAFKMAGAQNLVMSLWKINDKETAEFMQVFYKNLFDKQSVNDAFYNAQTEMKNKYRNEPYKWAAWVLVR